MVHRRTCSIACLTRSDSMSPFCAKLLTRAALVPPELRQAMLIFLIVCLGVPLRGRKRLVRKGSVRTVRRAVVIRS